MVFALLMNSYASFRMMIDGHGLAAALAGTEIRGFIVISTLPLLVYCVMIDFRLIKWFIIPFCTALFLKCLLLFYGYFILGGVEFMAGVRSVVVDGNALNSLSFGVIISLAFTTYLISVKRYTWAVIVSGLCVILICAVAGSFRRLVLLKTLIGSGIFIVLISYMKGRLMRNIPYFAAFGAVLITVIGSAYILIFGLEDARERFRSFTLRSEEGAFSSSNKFYIEDWTLLGETIVNTGGLGVGFRNEYGIAMRSDMGAEIAMANTEIPLHTGLYELWGRLGIFGAIFHFIAFIIIPLSAVQIAKKNNNLGVWLVAPSAAWLLFIGIFPFGAPPYLNISNWFYCSLTIGCLMAGVAPSAITLRPERAIRDRPKKLKRV
jgi:O-antigen ligase